MFVRTEYFKRAAALFSTALQNLYLGMGVRSGSQEIREREREKVLSTNSAAPVPGLSVQGYCHKPQIEVRLLRL